MVRMLVTGATGFVGRNLLPGLGGFEVTAAIRNPHPLPPGAGAAVAVDLLDATPRWDVAVEGADAVVHLAALAHRGGRFQRANRGLYDRANTSATLALAAAAARAGVRHFIFMSSIGVHGRTTDGRRPFREDDPLAPWSVYAESKAAAEKGLAEIAAGTGMACTILRAPLIYGPGAPGNLGALVKAIRAGCPLPPAQVANRRAFLGVQNLASFIRHRLARPAEGTRAFNLADAEQIPTPTFVAQLGTALGRKPRLFACPPAILRVAGLENLVSSLEVDTARAREDGWVPPLTLTEGLTRSFAPLTAIHTPEALRPRGPLC
jgi:UDP-glucose 4-epimerase